MNRIQESHARKFFAALLASCLVCAPSCVGTLQREPDRSAPSQPATPSRIAGMHEVLVMLAAAERRSSIELEGGRGGTLTFRRLGDMVLASDGRVGDELDLWPRAGSLGLAFEGRTYPGHLVVSAHPRDGLRLLNVVDLEQYVEAVVAAELPLWSAQAAELEAQAVAVRTYTLYTLAVRRAEQGESAVIFLWDSVEDQAYHGRAEPGASAGARSAHARLSQAVIGTRGVVLLRDGRLEDARYHASCGGRTANLVDVFPVPGPGATSVSCEPCLRRAAQEQASGELDDRRPLGWKRTFTADELSRAASALDVGDHILGLAAGRTDAAGRWIEAQVIGDRRRRTVQMDELRRALGHAQFKSARVASTWPGALNAIQDGLYVHGLGRGHGVGLCQEGARDYALQGWSMQQILAHYYPGTILERLP
ncbi:MAG: SpoIID/LytB domain-containing protein [Planctomycetota bacterium]